MNKRNKILTGIVFTILSMVTLNAQAFLTEIPSNGKINLNITADAVDPEGTPVTYRYEVLDADMQTILFTLNNGNGVIPTSVFRDIYHMSTFDVNNEYYIRLIASDGEKETTSLQLKSFKVKRGIEKITANSTVLYSCDDGWNLSGSLCSQVQSLPQSIQLCPDLTWTLEADDTCSKTIVDTVPVISDSTYSCSSTYVQGGSGATTTCTKDRVVTAETCPYRLPYKYQGSCWATHPSVTYYMPSLTNFVYMFAYTESPDSTYFYDYFYPENFCSNNDTQYGGYCSPTRTKQKGNYIYHPYTDRSGYFYDVRMLSNPAYQQAVNEAYDIMRISGTGYYIVNGSIPSTVTTTVYDDYYSIAPIETVSLSCIPGYIVDLGGSTCSKSTTQTSVSTSSVIYVDETVEKNANSSLLYSCPNGYAEYLTQENCFKYVD